MRRLIPFLALLGAAGVGLVAHAGPVTWSGSTVQLLDAGTSALSDKINLAPAGPTATGYTISCPISSVQPTNACVTAQVEISADCINYQPLAAPNSTSLCALDGGSNLFAWEIRDNSSPCAKVQLPSISADGGQIGGPLDGGACWVSLSGAGY